MKGPEGLLASIYQIARPASLPFRGRDSEGKTVIFGPTEISLNAPPSAAISLNQPDWAFLSRNAHSGRFQPIKPQGGKAGYYLTKKRVVVKIIFNII
jgi:hypothetical protein